MESILTKIAGKTATVGIIGLGYTGLSLAHDFGTEGFKIIGYDIDASKIKTLKKKESYLPFLPLGHLFYLLDEERFIPTSDPADLVKADVKIISVPTPLNAQRLPDISFLKKAVRTAGTFLDEGQLIIIQSTSFPGTTEEEALPLIETISNKKVGKDFFLAYVPEREDAGNPNAVLSQIPRICGGITPTCTKLARRLYEHITVKVHPCSSTRVAEAAKAFENAYRLINIAFVNEMKVSFDKMGINIWEVIEASSTKPFGFTPFYPGPGIGGECIPVDPIYLAWRAKQYAAPASMIENAIEINVKTSNYVVTQVTDALNQQAKSLNGAKILILGVAFKKDVGDIREAPALRIIPALQGKGAEVFYNDPYVPALKNLHLSSIPLEESNLSSYDCVVVISDHSRYDWEWICQQAHLIVDTRNATKKVPADFKKGKVYL